MCRALSRPMPCSPVSEPPASRQAIRICDASSSARSASPSTCAVVEHQRMQVAVAGVEDVGDAQPVLARRARRSGAASRAAACAGRRRPARSSCGSSRPIAGERLLAPAPEAGALLPRPRPGERCVAPAALADRRPPGRASPRPRPPGRPARPAGRRRRPAAGRRAARARRPGCVSSSIISIAAGIMPGGDDRRHRLAGGVGRRRSRRAASPRARGSGSTRTSASVTMPSVPSEPTTTPSRSSRPPARSQPDDLAVRQHHLEPQHVVGRDAVLQAVGAAGVLGDVAADRAGLLAGRVGRVVEAVRRDGAGDVEVGHARLHDGTRRLGTSTSRIASIRERPITIPSATGTAPPDRPVPAPRATNGTPEPRAGAHGGGHLRRRGRQHDRQRDRPVAGQAVRLIRAKRGGRRDQVLGPDRTRKIRQEAHPRKPTRGAILHG